MPTYRTKVMQWPLVEHDDRDFERECDDFGEDGYAVVAAVPFGANVLVIFQRAVEVGAH